ncbi:hypothetical protein [Modicisalibacter radicis]|uniref:hypothetical protein n=1 Tax=Halomonas sp. EAR18 TaxID=2518972 RepID=UPI00109C64F9|nr:hypothetical protein [Halomonas sp. EAR18]
MTDIEIHSELEADKLLQSGEWVRESEARYRMDKAIREEIARMFGEDLPFDHHGRIANAISDAVKDESTQKLHHHIQGSPQPKLGEVGLPDPQLELKVGFGTVIKLGPTFKNIKWNVLATIGAILTVSQEDKLAMIGTGALVLKPMYEVVLSLYQAVEKIEDPKELVVFEVVAALQALLTRDNLPIESMLDFDDLRGLYAVDVDEIVSFIPRYRKVREIYPPWGGRNATVRSLDVEPVLRALQSREILKDRDGQWSIAF